MRKRVTSLAFLCGVAGAAWAQPGAQITMPPNSWQEGAFLLANSCPTSETFQITAQPRSEWLTVETPTVLAGADNSFAVRVKVNTSGRALGTYRSSLTAVCASCAASAPPCLQAVKELTINMTVANVKSNGVFEPVADPSTAGALRTKPLEAVAQPAPDVPRRMRLWVIPLIGLGVLLAALIGLFLGMRSLASPARGLRVAAGEMPAESERHQVRR